MKIELDTIGLKINHETEKLLDYAKDQGIYSLETHTSSEKIIGQYRIEDFDISAKTAIIDKTLSREENFNKFKSLFSQSQKNLGYVPIHSLVFSREDDLLSEQGLSLWDLAEDFKDKEYVYKIGVRAKSPEKLIEIIDRIDIDIVQIPLNMLNQSFLGLLPELKEKRIEIHTYSTFLQGILLNETYNIPYYFNDIRQIIDSIPSPKSAYALSFPKLIKQIDKISIGCKTKEELEKIIQTYNYPVCTIDYSKFKVDDKKFINPDIFNMEL